MGTIIAIIAVLGVIIITLTFYGFRYLSNKILSIETKRTQNSNEITPSQIGLDDSYLFDFKNYASQYNNNGNGWASLDPGITRASSDSKSNEIIQKIKIKPIEVLVELETIPTPFTLTLIDEKISILKDKAKLITQKYSKREIEALIFRLENRKKYLQFKDYFDAFQNTTDEKIDVLLNKYLLVLKTSDIFVPEFPDEAIKVMNSYTDNMKLVCDKKPVFYVIAEEDNFKKAWDKRDPILLVQSPFGFYWQILGAWDKEMILLSEL